MYLLGVGTFSLLYMLYKFRDVNRPKKNFTIKYVAPDKLYFYCDEIVKFYARDELEKCLNLQIKNLNERNTWKDKINKVNDQLYFTFWKQNYQNVIKEFKENLSSNYCLWVYNNEISSLENSKVIILDLSVIYNYDNEDFTDKNYLINLSKFCYLYKIIFVLITELHPIKIEEFSIKYLNKNNITSPYNYRNKSFGGIIRLKENEFAEKPAELSINKIILDTFNRYGSNYTDTTYIGPTSIPKLNCKVIKNN